MLEYVAANLDKCVVFLMAMTIVQFVLGLVVLGRVLRITESLGIERNDVEDEPHIDMEQYDNNMRHCRADQDCAKVKSDEYQFTELGIAYDETDDGGEEGHGI